MLEEWGYMTHFVARLRLSMIWGKTWFPKQMDGAFTGVTFAVAATTNCETVDFAYASVTSQHATQVCKWQIPFRLCHIAQGLEMRIFDFLILSGESALHCLKAEKLVWFFPLCCLFVIKWMCTAIKEVTGITLSTWRCILQFQSFWITS